MTARDRAPIGCQRFDHIFCKHSERKYFHSVAIVHKLTRLLLARLRSSATVAPWVAGPTRKQRRLLLTLEAGVNRAALQRVLDRLRDEQVDLSEFSYTRQATGRALAATYGDHVTSLEIATTEGPFQWDIANPAVSLRS